MRAGRTADSGLWMKRAALASVLVGAILFAAKALVWWLTDSATMLSSAADSALDLAASLITLFAVRTALQPPDAEHRFGHGKAEGLSALAQGSIMLGSAAFLILHAIERAFDPASIEKPMSAYAVSLFAIVLTLALVLFQRMVIRKSGSVAISADSLHYTGDLLLNLAAMAGVALATIGGLPLMDGLFGAGIALFIALNARKIILRAIDMLMDREMPVALRDSIIEIALGNEQVRGIHDLKTRNAGLNDFIQFHLEVDPSLTLRAASLVALEVEAAVSELFPSADIAISLDPLGFEKPGRTMAEIAG